MLNCSKYGNSSLAQLCNDILSEAAKNYITIDTAINATREANNETRTAINETRGELTEARGDLTTFVLSTGWLARDINVSFLLWAGALVFSMHLGFGMVRGQRWGARCADAESDIGADVCFMSTWHVLAGRALAYLLARDRLGSRSLVCLLCS